MKRKFLIGIAMAVLIAGFLGFAVTRPLFLVQDKANGAQLLWNGHEAYLLVGKTRMGWATTPLGVGADVALSLVGGWPGPDTERAEVQLAHVTGDGVDVTTLRNRKLGFYTVFEGHLHEGPTLVWQGTAFVAVPDDEADRWVAAMQHYDQRDSGGEWASIQNVVDAAVLKPVPLDIDGKHFDLVARRDRETLILGVVGPDKTIKTLWMARTGLRSVSSSEYREDGVPGQGIDKFRLLNR